MIAYVHGIVENIETQCCIIDVNGVGINVLISDTTASRLPGIGEEVKLFTYTSVREDAFLLYGFLSRNELDLFKKLISVNGIGPKGGLALLSAMDADSLKYAICSQDAKAISKAPGIGAKTAQRLILELKDKLSFADNIVVPTVEGDNPYAEANGPVAEAVDALVALGYGRGESLKAVNSIEGVDKMDAGKILRAALKNF